MSEDWNSDGPGSQALDAEIFPFDLPVLFYVFGLIFYFFRTNEEMGTFWLRKFLGSLNSSSSWANSRKNSLITVVLPEEGIMKNFKLNDP